MTRNQFLKGCAAGMCSCAVPVPAAGADSQEARRTLDAARVRFARLVGVLADHLDQPARKRIFEDLGRECARQYRGLTEKYRGDVEGFLKMARTQWVETAEYDPAAGTIRIVDKAKHCTCPLVKPGVTPPDFCNCTLGWQKEAYSAILGRPVEAELEESILRGGSRCVFRIRAARV
jgi:hypothetical protein